MTDAPRPLSNLDRTRINRVLPAVIELAEQLTSRWGRQRFDDVLSAGSLKLAEIAPKFDPAIQEEFMAFAYVPVRGAMLRELFKTMTLEQREKAVYAMDLRDGPVNPAGKDLLAGMMSFDREPSSKAELRSYLQLRAAGLFLAAAAETKEAETPEDEVARRLDYKKAVRALEEAIQNLDARGKKVVELIYYDQVTLDQAGAKLGAERGKPYTIRHVSRMHEEVREKLADALRAVGITSAPDGADEHEDN